MITQPLSQAGVALAEPAAGQYLWSIFGDLRPGFFF